MSNLLFSKLLLALCVSLLASCSGVYRDPPKNPAITAELRNSGKTWSLYHWENFNVEMIDDLAVNYSLSWSARTRVIRVKAGKHLLVVTGSFNKAFMGAGPFNARTDLIADFKAGHSYHLMGKVEGSSIKFWIEDDVTHEMVSNMAVEKYGVTPTSSSYPIFVPIVTS